MSHNRLRILTNDEIESLYGRPHFLHEERHEYFSLSVAEEELINQLRTTKSKVYFILQLGYFKAKHLFFNFDLDQVSGDVAYVLHRYFSDEALDTVVDKQTRLRQQRLILQLFQYRRPTDKQRELLQIKAGQAARVCGKPVYVFRSMLQYLAEKKILVPGYSFMQDLVSQALGDEQDRLMNQLQQKLQEVDRVALDALVQDSDGFYQITQLKHEPKDFSLKQVKDEIARGQYLRPLYEVAQTMLPQLGISNESITYYASLVYYYSVYRLKRFESAIVCLYLLCFIYHRYQKLHDRLIESLIAKMKGYQEEAKIAAKERVYTLRIQTNEHLQKAGEVLKLFTDDTISASMPFAEVQRKAFAILGPEYLNSIADHMRTDAYFDQRDFEWEHIDELSHQFKRQIRPLLLALDLASANPEDPVIEAMRLLKSTFKKGQPLKAPLLVRFIPETLRRYIYGKQQTPLPDRYEFLLYRQLRQEIEAGDVFCGDSIKYRSFEDDLIGDLQWKKNEHLIAQTGLKMFDIRAHLNELQNELEQRLTQVNEHIASGDNEYIKVKTSRWSVAYPPGREPINHTFFDALKQVQIGSVLHYVNQACGFMKCFEHIVGRYVKSDLDERALVATLLAWGTNMGVGQMAQNSDISYTSLSQTSDNFIRLETLAAANDQIANATAALPIFEHYDIDPPGNGVHSSSDGQKFETRIHTFKARHSPKYFGLKKGVVACTVVANHVPINADVIGAHDHESHYVFDLLFNNTTDIEPVVHSTDTDGTNEVNFALLHLFGYQFAPRYRDLYDKVRTSLYGFQHPSNYDGLLRPIRKINTGLIIEEWKNIERILVSLALKTTQQSIIISKLSSHARKNKTKRALWEYDNIIQSLYLLDYIDSPPLRRNVQRALNRGENYHQLRRAVSYANFGKLRFKTEYEQKLWSECSRLITNCIIHYNMTLLSNLWMRRRGEAWLTEISPVAWQHINLCGQYEFGSIPKPINMKAIIDRLEQLPLRVDLQNA